MYIIPKGLTIFYESNHCLVIIKPRGLNTLPVRIEEDYASSDSLLQRVFFYFPEVRYVEGKNKKEGGLLHRLDRDTEGLILIARTQEFYDFIKEQASKHLFRKRYLAHCFRIPSQCVPSGYTLQTWERELQKSFSGSYLFHCSFVKAEAKSSRVRPVVQTKKNSYTKVIYQTRIQLTHKKPHIQALCETSRGFRHQIRASLSNLGLPILGDPFYPDLNPSSKEFYFWAVGLSFLEPKTYKRINLEYTPSEMNDDPSIFTTNTFS